MKSVTNELKNMPGRLKSAVVIVTAGASLFCGYSLVEGNERFYREVAMPCIQLLDAERAHRFGVWTASKGLIPRNKYVDPPSLRTDVWGLTFQNPIGLAAGFDKHAEAMDGLIKIGFGFVEVGSITPEPQPGNPKPRVFRLSEDHAVINRYGFNSEGHVAALKRLKARMYHKANHPEDHQGIVGINFGKNKTSPDSVGDYTKGIRNLGCFGDYLVINVSSPNTPGLRDMQGKKNLTDLIEKVLEARNNLPVDPKPPLLVKIAPDLTEQDKIDIASVVLRPKSRVDGLIVSNTTIGRPASLISINKTEVGGLSGEPLKALATETIRDMYKLTEGSIPIVGVGGITSGKDAFEKIRAGASLVQLYTALSYQGPPLITRIKRELVDELQNGGFDNVQAAVGADHR